MASIGDRILFNEGDATVDSWAVGFIVATDSSNPGAYDHFGGTGYPATPDTGTVMVCYAGMVGNTGPTWAFASNVTEGTGLGQYQPLT